MALTYPRVQQTADSIAEVANQMTSLLARIEQVLTYNSNQAIDWNGSPKPSYITEDAAGNLDGRPYSRGAVANAIDSLLQMQKLMTNLAPSQGDHLGNLNQLARPLG